MSKRELVPDWRYAWKWYSIHALVIAGALPAAWAALPMEWRAVLPASAMSIVTIVTAICGVIGRVTQQEDGSDQRNS